MFYECALHFLFLCLILSAAISLGVWAVGQYFKMSAETTVSLGVQTGDAESMNFTTNFRRGQTEAEKQKTAQEIFDVVAKRRADNHAAYLEIKRKAIEENEAAIARGEGDKTLRSIAEGGKKGS